MTRIQLCLLVGSFSVLLPMATSAQEVHDREINQQRRIGQGIGSGQITSREATNLERRESAIDASRRAALAVNGGHLTGREYRNLNRRENVLSRQIYVDKHNDVAQPGVLPR